jgi:hypothetical protein
MRLYRRRRSAYCARSARTPHWRPARRRAFGAVSPGPLSAPSGGGGSTSCGLLNVQQVLSVCTFAYFSLEVMVLIVVCTRIILQILEAYSGEDNA